MTGTKRAVYVRFLIVFALISAVGVLCTVYILIQQRAELPFENVYELKAEFTAADGVISGLGQPVNVAGVKVGQVTEAELVGDSALVTMEIQRELVPRVHENGAATLEPITPLEDMQLELDPGRPPAAALPPGGMLGVERTNRPVPISDLLSALDTDTRTFLGSLISSLDYGTRKRGPDLRRVLLALGPTAADAGRVNRALAQRRQELARLVHNLGRVTRAASRDRRLAEVVVAGNDTVEAFAQQDEALRATIAKLPPTLEVTRATLADIEPFARELRPTVDELLPGVRRLPRTLRDLRPFADTATTALRRDIRPLIRDARPLVEDLDPAVRSLSEMTPDLAQSFQVLEYLVNELAYNAPGDDEGFLFWFPWFFHNFNSIASSGDAHGGIGRAFPLVSCFGLQELEELQGTLGVTGLCDN